MVTYSHRMVPEIFQTFWAAIVRHGSKGPPFQYIGNDSPRRWGWIRAVTARKRRGEDFAHAPATRSRLAALRNAESPNEGKGIGYQFTCSSDSLSSSAVILKAHNSSHARTLFRAHAHPDCSLLSVMRA